MIFFKNLFVGIHKDEKQIVTEGLPTMVNNKRQTPKDFVMKTVKEPMTTISSGLGMKSSNIGEDNVLIFDPGDDADNEQHIINLFKEIIIKKGFKDDEGGDLRENCSKTRSSLKEVDENGNMKINGDENNSEDESNDKVEYVTRDNQDIGIDEVEFLNVVNVLDKMPKREGIHDARVHGIKSCQEGKDESRV